MTTAVDTHLIEFAIGLARAAGQLSTAYFFDRPVASRKADGSEVTAADLAVEDLVRTELARFAPDDGILGEEYGETAGLSANRWIIDPISGTAYFTRHMPLFANLITFEDAAGAALGIINMPVQREMIVAIRDGGCHLLTGDDDLPGKASRVTVSDRSRLDGALTLAANQSAWSEELLVALHRKVALVGAIHHSVVHVVTGRADAAVLTHQGYDDLAGLPLILKEAGGRATSLTGGPVLASDSDGTVLATNGRLHDEYLHLVAGLTATRGPKALT